MYIRRLSLTNFRNFARLELALPPRVILLHGANAQGKTNLLEAVYYLATSRSPQTNTDRELINWIADEEEMVPFARVAAEVMHGDRTQEIEIVLQKEPVAGDSNGDRTRLRKQIRVDRAKRRAMDLVGQINVVLFMPQDMALVDGPPSGRRRYLDIALCQVDREYCRTLSRYNKVVSERNALLRQWNERRIDPDELAYWDTQLVQHGTLVMLRRRDAVDQLNQQASELHYQLSGDTEALQLIYESTVAVEPQDGTERLRQRYRAELAQQRGAETERGMTLVGPHRDEVLFMVNERIDLGTFGSRGQQRTAVVATKLAEVEWMRQRTGQWPILLLDEVLAELDARRRDFLLDQIDRVEQTLITTTDPGLLGSGNLTDVKLLQVQSGQIFENNRGVS
jgi:DNA replication and repair protein RecF